MPEDSESPAPGYLPPTPQGQVFWVRQTRILAVLLVLQGLYEIGYWSWRSFWSLTTDERFEEMLVLSLCAQCIPLVIFASLKIGAGFVTYNCRLFALGILALVSIPLKTVVALGMEYVSRNKVHLPPISWGDILSVERLNGLIILVYGAVVYCSPTVRREFLARRQSSDSIILARLFFISSMICFMLGILTMLMLAGMWCLPEPLDGYFLFIFITIPSIYLPDGLMHAPGHIPVLNTTGVLVVYFCPAILLLIVGIAFRIRNEG